MNSRHREDRHGVFLEIGKKKAFAGAVDWPGWCRAGRDEEAAITALLEAGPRYERVMRAGGLTFKAPQEASGLNILERVEGSSTTDFGATDASLSTDDEPLADGELQQLQALLSACWKAFDEAVEKAQGRVLRKGPRGGGRELDSIVEHVVSAEEAYVRALGWTVPEVEEGNIRTRLEKVREAALQGIEAAARGEIAASGPRGGKRWLLRYFVRRVAWHVLDHAWEIEDRMQNS